MSLVDSMLASVGLVRRAKVRPTRVVDARYDSAQTTEGNSKHWAFSDGLSASAAASPGVRRVLRSRARYESENNSYAGGMVRTLANSVIGTGPRLQTDPIIERIWRKWAKEIRLATKLRTMRIARCKDGEAFALLVRNDRLKSPIKLDLRLIEAEQVCTPDFFLPSGRQVDGIVFDEFGNPETYHVLKHHPGDLGYAGSLDYDKWDAANVLHWFFVERPGQSRGIPEIQSSLSLYAQLRRYTLSVLDAAETAANLSALIYTDAPPDPEDLDAAEPFDTFELERNTAMTLPMGWKAQQLKAEQPTSAYSQFKREIVGESGRCLNMPYNIASGDSSNYNYSSGRLDRQIFFESVEIDRGECEDVVLDPIFARFMEEASLVDGLLPQELKSSQVDRSWYWDQPVSIDPVKDASAKETRLRSKQATLAQVCGEEGVDWRDHVAQLAEEIRVCDEAGVVHPAKETAPAATAPATDPTDEPADPEDDLPQRTQQQGAA